MSVSEVIHSLLRMKMRQVRQMVMASVNTVRTRLNALWTQFATQHPALADQANALPHDTSHLTDLVSLTAGRHIETSTSTTIPDGIGLPELLCSTQSGVTELTDSRTGWTYNNENALQTILNGMPNLSHITLNCETASAYMINNTTYTRAIRIDLPNLKTINTDRLIYADRQSETSVNTNIEVHLDSLETVNQSQAQGTSYFYVGKVYMPELKSGTYRNSGHASYSNNKTSYIYLGCKGSKSSLITIWNNYNTNNYLTDLEIRDGACQRITLTNNGGLTEQNMYDHILCRLKQDEPVGTQEVVFRVSGFDMDVDTITPHRSPIFDDKGGQELTDIFVFDGKEQVCHQVSGDEDFGTIKLPLTIGQHSLSFVATRSTGVDYADGVLSCASVKPTFGKLLALEVTNAISTQDVTLQRVTGQLNITIADAFPVQANEIEFVIADKYADLDVLSLCGVNGTAFAQRVSCAAYHGVSGRSYTFNLFTPVYGSEYQATVTINVYNSSNVVIYSKTITGVRLAANTKTNLTGKMFDGAGATINVDIEWNEPLNGSF